MSMYFEAKFIPYICIFILSCFFKLNPIVPVMCHCKMANVQSLSALIVHIVTIMVTAAQMVQHVTAMKALVELIVPLIWMVRNMLQ